MVCSSLETALAIMSVYYESGGSQLHWACNNSFRDYYKRDKILESNPIYIVYNGDKCIWLDALHVSVFSWRGDSECTKIVD